MVQTKGSTCPGWHLPLPSLDLDPLMPSHHFLAIEELQAAVGDLPFLDNVGQMNGAFFYWESGEWHWLVKSQPLLHDEFQSSEQYRYSDSNTNNDQVSIDSPSQEISPEEGQTFIQVPTSSLKRSLAGRDDDLFDDQPYSSKRRRAGDVGDQKRLRKSSTTLVPSYLQQIQQPGQESRSMSNQRPQKPSQVSLPNYRQQIRTSHRKHQSISTNTTPRRVSKKENVVNQKKSKGKNAGWNAEEGDKLRELLMNQRADEKANNQKPLRDVKLWGLMSQGLKKYHIDRSPSSCKAHWSRQGRPKTGFDERVNPNPSMLATSLQGKNRGKKVAARETKREGEKTVSVVVGYHDDEQDDYKTPCEDFPRAATSEEDREYHTHGENYLEATLERNEEDKFESDSKDFLEATVERNEEHEWEYDTGKGLWLRR